MFVRWRVTGTHTGPRFGVEPTGRPIAVDDIDHFGLRDGKVATLVVGADGMVFARQMGLMLADGPLPDGALQTTTKFARRLPPPRAGCDLVVRSRHALAVHKDADGGIEVAHPSNLTKDEAIELGTTIGALSRRVARRTSRRVARRR